MITYKKVRHYVKVQLNFRKNYSLSWLFIIKNHILNKKNIVLINLLEHLGDIVACEPIVRYLLERNPNSIIIWGVKKPYQELIDNNPFIDKTLLVHCLTESNFLMESGLFDEVVNLHFHDRYCALCWKPLKKTPHGASEIGLNNYFNYGGLLSSMAQSAGLPPLEAAPQIYIPHSAVERADNLGLPSNYIAINCTSNAREKNWPQEKWKVLIERVTDSLGIPIYELGLKSLISSPMPLYTNLCGSLSILETAEVIKRARLFIGIDSGPAHLANAVGTFGIIMMGSYLGFKQYNPFSGRYQNGLNAILLYATGSVQTISVATVFSSVERYLAKT